MTAYATYTPIAIPRYPFNEIHTTATQADNDGDVVEMGSGLFGVVQGLGAGADAVAIGDPVCFRTAGIYDVLCYATTDTYADGAPVYFDTVNKYAVTAGSATCLYLGYAVGAKASGAATVRVALNGNIAPSLAGAATASSLTVSGTTTLTGAVTASSTLATGAVTIADATTPSLTTAAGKTNTGYVQVNGKTSGGVKIIPADATAYLLTISVAARTVGTATLTIPDTANVADTFALVTLAQTLANKTLTSPVIATGLTASGSAANDFSGSTGTFKTSTGTNTFGGDTACLVGSTVTAAGANQGAATALNEGDLAIFVGVTGQTGYGIKFPSASFAGKRVILHGNTFACKLYPYSTENLGAGASTAVTIAANTDYLVYWPTAGTGIVVSLGTPLSA